MTEGSELEWDACTALEPQSELWSTSYLGSQIQSMPLTNSIASSPLPRPQAGFFIFIRHSKKMCELYNEPWNFLCYFS